jgi:ribosome-binding ATPase YchF (GTP1/OBG family)
MYQGRGRGNKFLNDLCDADVLIHVVDASGTTDADGVAAEGDPVADIGWVREVCFAQLARALHSLHACPPASSPRRLDGS